MIVEDGLVKNIGENSMTEIAMQTRCVFCGREQYAMAVSAISKGEHPCVWCGEKSEPMTYEEYYKKLDDLKRGK